MNYMLSFFDKENIVLFWDEPTITMDYDDHILHKSLSHIWKINQIPRIILSSATLPNHLQPIIENYKLRFEGVFYKIETTDHISNIILILFPCFYVLVYCTTKEEGPLPLPALVKGGRNNCVSPL